MEQKLKKIMSNLFGIAESAVNDGSSMRNIPRWDSMKHMEFVISIEEEFELSQLSMDEIVKMTSVAEIKNVLRSHGVGI